MDLGRLRNSLRDLIVRHLRDGERYRSLLIQSHSVATLRTVNALLEELIETHDRSGRCLEAPAFLDEVGAAPCSAVIDTVGEVAPSHLVLIPGPLNFVDYWAPSIALTFWRYLATFETGPGILVTDAPREEPNRRLFRVVARLPGDIRCLRSRLAITQEGRR